MANILWIFERDYVPEIIFYLRNLRHPRSNIKKIPALFQEREFLNP
jgi:hypothetical protein